MATTFPKRSANGARLLSLALLLGLMMSTGIQQSPQSSPPARLTLFLVNLPLPQALPGPLYPRITQLKLKAIQSVNVPPKNPPTIPSPTVPGHHFRPSLYGIQRDNSANLPGTPGIHSRRQTLHMKKAMINWITDKKKTMVTSVVASTNTLTDFIDKEMSVSHGDMETPIPLLSPSSTAVLFATPKQPIEYVYKERMRRVAMTERHPSRKRKSYVQTNPSRARVIAPMHIIEKIPFREAIRDREWTTKAKEALIRDWSKALQLSNGVTVNPPTEGYFSYTFYLGRGNNHQLVKNCFKSRSHWMRVVDEEEMHEVNVVWTQSKVKSLFKAYQCAEEKSGEIRKPNKMSIGCSLKLSSKTSTSLSKGRHVDISALGYDLITQSPSFTHLPPSLRLNSPSLSTHNKLEHNYHLTNKKTLFISLRTYCGLVKEKLFDLIPVTFHIANGLLDLEFQRFLEEHTSVLSSETETDDHQKRLRGVWIIKPGENTNRGTGITVCSSLEQIKAEISSQAVCPVTGLKRTFVLQKYIENPLLISRRKFDIRCFALVTAINGVVQGYFYQEGYLRTSSKEFSLKDVSNRFIHLTNDAVQKYSEDYGKFEAGNKLSYSDFQRYLDTHTTTAGRSVQSDIVAQIRKSVKTSMMATFAKLNAGKRQFSFEILGYDFMVDSSLKVWLIEVNTNPCLEMSSPLLARIIPSMLDNAFRIAIDPYFPESTGGSSARKPTISLTGETIPENKFELVFSSVIDGAEIRHNLGNLFPTLEEFDPALQDMPDDEESFEDEASDEEC